MTRLGWILAGLAGAAALPLALRDEPYFLDMLVLVGHWGALAGAWNIAAGYGGLISLGHAAFFGIGAYSSSLLGVRLGVSPWLGIWAGAGLAAAFAVLLSAVTARMRGAAFSLVTIAVAELVLITAMHAHGLTQGSEGVYLAFAPSWSRWMFQSKLPYVYLALGLAGLIAATSVWLERSRFGHYLESIREDEMAARSIGVPAATVKGRALALSAGFTAAAGTFHAQYTGFIDPPSVLAIPISIQLALVTMIGGLGRPLGPVLGAVVMVPVGQLLRGWLGGRFGALHLALYGLLVILIVRYAPGGLLSGVARVVSARPGPATPGRVETTSEERV